MRNLTNEETEIYNSRYETEAVDVNKRVDDAFMELHTQLGRMNGLTRDYSKLKQELIKLQEAQKSNLLWSRILTGISAAMWVILLILKFV